MPISAGINDMSIGGLLGGNGPNPGGGLVKSRFCWAPTELAAGANKTGGGSDINGTCVLELACGDGGGGRVCAD